MPYCGDVGVIRIAIGNGHRRCRRLNEGIVQHEPLMTRASHGVQRTDVSGQVHSVFD